MSQRRIRSRGLGSGFGDWVYSRVVPRNHFLVKLNALIGWEPCVPILLPADAGLAAAGRPPYSRVGSISKCVWITHLYN